MSVAMGGGGGAAGGWATSRAKALKLRFLRTLGLLDAGEDDIDDMVRASAVVLGGVRMG